MAKERIPAEVFPPGDFIREELEYRGWSQAVLAEILGRPLTRINEILCGKREVTAETARALGQVFGTSAEYWMNLESAYRLHRLHSQDDSVERRSRLYSKAPIRDMTRRGWLEKSDNVAIMEQQLLKFLEIDMLDDTPVLLPHAARKATSYSKLSPAETVWLVRARTLARNVAVNSQFSQASLDSALGRLRPMLSGIEKISEVPSVLAEAGIRFIILQHLPSTKVDGACFWLDADNPVVALSMRFDRIDYFWYTLMHEIAHVYSGDGLDKLALDSDLMDGRSGTANRRPGFETRADQIASHLLLPEGELNEFIARVRPKYSKPRLLAFAAHLGVHEGILVGRLQHMGEIPWSHNREMLVKVRDLLTASAVTDGWGRIPQLAA